MLCLAVLSGCTEEEHGHMSANLSLVEIGERSLESAERLEAAGNLGDAEASYKRAVWAFGYHERLTGEQALLMDEAKEGVSRLNHRRR
jgi:hypothetical protein